MTATLTRTADYSHYDYSGYSARRSPSASQSPAALSSSTMAPAFEVRLPRRHTRSVPTRHVMPQRASSGPMARPTVAIVHLRRRVVAALAFTGTMLMLWAGAGNVLANRGDDPASVSPVRPGATHVARPGESLWLIADEFRGDVPQDDYLQDLIDLNGGSQLIVGQVVRLP